MLSRALKALPALALTIGGCADALPSSASVLLQIEANLQAGSLVNVHLHWQRAPKQEAGAVSAYFAHCNEPWRGPKEGRASLGALSAHTLPDRLALVVPEQSASTQCIFIEDSASALLGKSPPFTIVASRQRRSQTRPALSDFDALGAWYDGVAAIGKKSNRSVYEHAKNRSIAIVGAGISGLATGLMLDSVGIHNWELIEASNRVGGRFRTKFVGGTDEWAEMGPMRLPHSIKYHNGDVLEYTDHQMTFRLAEVLNEMNRDDPHWRVDFIPWIQHHPNELLGRDTGRLANGRVPTRAEVAANSSLAAKTSIADHDFTPTKESMNRILKDSARLRSIQNDIWAAHRKAMDQGLDDWSEQAMMRHVFKANENVTDAILSATDYDIFWDEMVHNSNLAQDGSASAFGETRWKCIDRGFQRLADAFLPHIKGRLRLNRKVRKVAAITDEKGRTVATQISWFPSVQNRTFESKTYDYTIMTAPFTMTRFMELPEFSSVLTRAMGERGLRFKSACKVALLFSKRFWEHGERPIFGGYSQPESKAVGALYYPVYNLNETGRPGLIMHYRGGDWSDRFVSFSDEEHVQTVLDAIVSLHGDQARQLYTGHYERLCWLQDEHSATSWCRPNVMQHKLYIPAYHNIEHNMIFIGEHTAPTHAWVSSSLHSAVRGTVQLLLDLGLIDEAKELNQRWMGRWIKL
ncbi:unnamed protein product [Parajaminaea phylloscopi]